MSKDYYPQEPIKGTCLRVICCMYSALFCFSDLYLKLLFFEKGGLIFSIFSYFYVPHRRGGGHIVFGADPVGVGVSVGVGVGVTLSCLHDIS